MNSFKSIILIGPPATGKSTIGGMLSKKWGIPFFDLDIYIEKKYRRTIVDLFRKGESYFRLLETQCLEELSRRSKPSFALFSVGGGAPLHKKNWELFKKMGKVLYLKTSIDEIMMRLPESLSIRPLFFNKSEGEIRFILNERENFYIPSDLVVDTTQKTKEKVCKEIVKWVEGGI